jgi:hypothetical protein
LKGGRRLKFEHLYCNEALMEILWTFAISFTQESISIIYNIITIRGGTIYNLFFQRKSPYRSLVY